MALNPLMAFWNRKPKTEQRFTLDDWAQFFNFGGLTYPFIEQSMGPGPREQIGANFAGYVQAYKGNPIIFACIAARASVFSEARFQFQQLNNGRPGDLFGTQDLAMLEEPWPGATTGDLLTRMLTDADLAGNAFFRRRPPARPGGAPRVQRLRPDWVTIISGSETTDPSDTVLLGYIYQPGGPGSGEDPVTLLADEVAHFAPFPDPTADFRGVSWVTAVVNDILGDNAASAHKLKFFEQGATPNMVVTLGNVDLTPEKFEEWVEKMELSHAGSVNAYRTLYLAAGADAKVVGANLEQINFEAVQGAGETRIAAAARIPPIIVGLSEGLDAATYSNYGQAKRSFADGTLRPLWRNAAGSLQTLVPTPPASRLWIDDRDIPFLQEDMKDAAEIMSTEAGTISTLVTAGFEVESVKAAVLNGGDWDRLRHTGMFSVQLQAPGAVDPPAVANGNTPKALPAPSSN